MLHMLSNAVLGMSSRDKAAIVDFGFQSNSSHYVVWYR